MNITTTRAEAFSDGVIAIIITIMVFDIKISQLARVDTSAELRQALIMMSPKLIAYLLSFVIIGIMWLNHHHMFHMIQLVDEKTAWLNLNFLFWLSLIPFPTSIIGAHPLLSDSAAIYGAVLFMMSLSFALLRRYVHKKGLMHQDNARLDRKIDKANKRAGIKNILGMFAYLLSVPAAYYSVYLSFVLFLIPPALFFVPDGVPEAGEVLPGGESGS